MPLVDVIQVGLLGLACARAYPAQCSDRGAFPAPAPYVGCRINWCRFTVPESADSVQTFFLMGVISGPYRRRRSVPGRMGSEAAPKQSTGCRTPLAAPRLSARAPAIAPGYGPLRVPAHGPARAPAARRRARDHRRAWPAGSTA